MSDMNVTAATSAYADYSTAPAKSDTAAKKEETTAAAEESVGAVYEKNDKDTSGIYKINKMSAEDRKALVSQLKADQEARQAQLLDLVSKMVSGQAKSFSLANDDDSIWKFLAEGNFEVDAATKAQAQEDISEDGYWGVKQTSQRMFDFASALAGDDEDKMKEMQEAMHKGFKEATSAWGRDLPSITNDTLSAADKLFEDYFASKKTTVE